MRMLCFRVQCLLAHAVAESTMQAEMCGSVHATYSYDDTQLFDP